MKRITIIMLTSFLVMACHKGKGGLPDNMKYMINNSKYANSDGKVIIGFTYRKKDLKKYNDPFNREPLNPQAVYEDDEIPELFFDH